MKVNNRIIGLDLFRGFCGYGVAVCHLEAFLYSNIHFEYLSLLFVEFFFVLSGFVLYPQLTLLIDNKKNLLIFYKRRWLRTLPLYITFLILASILFGQLFSLNFLKYLFFIQKLFPHFLSSHYYPIAWSLSIEEFFYLLAPLLLIFSNRKNFLARIVIVFAIILLIKLLVADHVDSNFFRTGTILRLDSILVGFIFRHFFSFFYKIKYFFIVLLLLLIPLFLFYENYFILHQNAYFIKLLFVFFLQLLSILTLSFFIFIEPLIKNKLLDNFAKIVSNQTYSIYLIHFFLIYFIDTINLDKTLEIIIYVISLFIFSYIIYNLVEKPILKNRPKFVND